MKIIKKIIIKFNLINIFSFPFYFFRICKIKQNKIICVNFSGRGYGDNPKAIVEELLKLDNNLDIVWIVKNIDDTNFPSKVRKVKIYSLKYFYEMATAKIWINNSRFPLFVRKRKKQCYINTWHGGLGLKKIEQDAIDKLSDYYKKSAPHDSSMIDVMISNSKYRTNLFKKSFWYDGKIYECGCPRNDIFFKTEVKSEVEKKIKKLYNIPYDTKIILYAPTFRLNSGFNYNSIDFKTLIEKMENNHNEKYVFMIRLHSKVANIKLPENIINATFYPDTDELLLASDILISDYSSIMFDFLYTNRPVYLYAPDYDLYNDERGLNFVYEDLPFSISYSNDELIHNIINYKCIEYNEKLKLFLDEMGVIDDGTASKDVSELIMHVINGGDLREKI